MRMKKIININTNCLNALSRIFTPLVLDNIATKGYSSYLSEVCENSNLKQKVDLYLPFADFLNWIYNLLFKKYRNEYIYKNVIANKILLGKHSLNTSQMLTEFRVGKCKADAVVINGTSTIYEIKSEFDSFTRLKNQLSTYMQVFDHINVITSEQQAKKLINELPESVGVHTLTNRNTISIIRESVSNKINIKPEVLFDSLRKNEYLSVIKNNYGSIPDVPNTRIFNECKTLFVRMPPELAHDTTMPILRKRNENDSLGEFLANAPDSLSAFIISNANRKKKLQSLSKRFLTDIGSILEPA